MERRPFDKDNVGETVEWIFRNAAGLPIILLTAPIKQEDMKSGSMGIYGNTLYIRFATGEIKSVELTHVV